MENNKEREEALRKSQNEVAKLELILKDLLGMDISFIPKFQKNNSHLQAPIDKDIERLETQLFLSGLRKKEAVDKQNEEIQSAQLKQDFLSKGTNAIQGALVGLEKNSTKKNTSRQLYEIIFKFREQKSIVITKAMYESLYSEGMDTSGMLHGKDGDEMMSLRASDVRAIVKV